MRTMYINRKTSKLYSNSDSNSTEQVLIYGEKIKVSGEVINNRLAAVYRKKYNGFVKVSHLTTKPVLEMYFIDVGQADATFIITPDKKKVLVDGGGNSQTVGFLSWKYQLASPNSEILVIDLLVLSHADGDHLKGLIPILRHKKIIVKKIIHNGIGKFKNTQVSSGNLSPDGEYLDSYHSQIDELDGLNLESTFKKWTDLIKELEIPYEAVSSDTGFIDIGDSKIDIQILGPVLDFDINNKPRLKWFDSHSHSINGHSVVFKITYKKVRAMFSGDLNIDGGKHILKDLYVKSHLDSHIFKTPHHGSHEFHLPFLEAVRPQISVISSGDSPDHGHPRANFIGAIGLASRSKMPLVFSTSIASTFIDAKEIDLARIDPSLNLNDLDLKRARIFKKRLHGMINIRTNGKDLYAMRRVNTGYWWESYGPIKAENINTIF